MKLKKFIAILSVATMTAGLAVGCGSSDSASSDDKSSKSESDWDSSNDITIVSREDGSGTRDGFQEIVGFESKDLTSNAQISDGSGNIKTTVQGNENAIGYISFGYLDDSINAVKIGGVEPKEENVYNDKYPISRPFLLVTKGEASGDAKSFIDYVLSDAGQKTIEKQGFMSVNQK